MALSGMMTWDQNSPEGRGSNLLMGSDKFAFVGNTFNAFCHAPLLCHVQ